MKNTGVRAPGQEGRKLRTLGLEHLGKRVGSDEHWC